MRSLIQVRNHGSSCRWVRVHCNEFHNYVLSKYQQVKILINLVETRHQKSIKYFFQGSHVTILYYMVYVLLNSLFIDYLWHIKYALWDIGIINTVELMAYMWIAGFPTLGDLTETNCRSWGLNWDKYITLIASLPLYVSNLYPLLRDDFWGCHVSFSENWHNSCDNRLDTFWSYVFVTKSYQVKVNSYK